MALAIAALFAWGRGNAKELGAVLREMAARSDQKHEAAVAVIQEARREHERELERLTRAHREELAALSRTRGNTGG